MGYRVRNEYGELRFESFTELKDAYLHELVGPDDEILEDGSTHWRKASTVSHLVRAARERPSAFALQQKWWVLAALVLVVGVALLVALTRSSLLGFLLIIGVAGAATSYFMWEAHRRRR